jgi:hypothetical protein
MDPKLIAMLTEYMRKTASLNADVQDFLTRTGSYIDRQDQQKEASFSTLREKAVRTVYAMANTRNAAGHPLISGDTQIKQATAMLSKHDSALDVLQLVLGAAFQSKEGSYREPGTPAAGQAQRKRTSVESFYEEVLNKPLD